MRRTDKYVHLQDCFEINIEADEDYIKFHRVASSSSISQVCTSLYYKFAPSNKENSRNSCSTLGSDTGIYCLCNCEECVDQTGSSVECTCITPVPEDYERNVNTPPSDDANSKSSLSVRNSNCGGTGRFSNSKSKKKRRKVEEETSDSEICASKYCVFKRPYLYDVIKKEDIVTNRLCDERHRIIVRGFDFYAHFFPAFPSKPMECKNKNTQNTNESQKKTKLAKLRALEVARSKRFKIYSKRQNLKLIESVQKGKKLQVTVNRLTKEEIDRWTKIEKIPIPRITNNCKEKSSAIGANSSDNEDSSDSESDEYIPSDTLSSDEEPEVSRKTAPPKSLSDLSEKQKCSRISSSQGKKRKRANTESVSPPMTVFDIETLHLQFCLLQDCLNFSSNHYLFPPKNQSTIGEFFALDYLSGSSRNICMSEHSDDEPQKSEGATSSSVDSSPSNENTSESSLDEIDQSTTATGDVKRIVDQSKMLQDNTRVNVPKDANKTDQIKIPHTVGSTENLKDSKRINQSTIVHGDVSTENVPKEVSNIDQCKIAPSSSISENSSKDSTNIDQSTEVQSSVRTENNSKDVTKIDKSTKTYYSPRPENSLEDTNRTEFMIVNDVAFTENALKDVNSINQSKIALVSERTENSAKDSDQTDQFKTLTVESGKHAELKNIDQLKVLHDGSTTEEIHINERNAECESAMEVTKGDAVVVEDDISGKTKDYTKELHSPGGNLFEACTSDSVLTSKFSGKDNTEEGKLVPKSVDGGYAPPPDNICKACNNNKNLSFDEFKTQSTIISEEMIKLAGMATHSLHQTKVQVAKLEKLGIIQKRLLNTPFGSSTDSNSSLNGDDEDDSNDCVHCSLLEYNAFCEDGELMEDSECDDLENDQLSMADETDSICNDPCDLDWSCDNPISREDQNCQPVSQFNSVEEIGSNLPDNLSPSPQASNLMDTSHNSSGNENFTVKTASPLTSPQSVHEECKTDNVDRIFSSVNGTLLCDSLEELVNEPIEDLIREPLDDIMSDPLDIQDSELSAVESTIQLAPEFIANQSYQSQESLPSASNCEAIRNCNNPVYNPLGTSVESPSCLFAQPTPNATNQHSPSTFHPQSTVPQKQQPYEPDFSSSLNSYNQNTHSSENPPNSSFSQQNGNVLQEHFEGFSSKEQCEYTAKRENCAKASQMIKENILKTAGHSSDLDVKTVARKPIPKDTPGKMVHNQCSSNNNVNKKVSVHKLNADVSRSQVSKPASNSIKCGEKR